MKYVAFCGVLFAFLATGICLKIFGKYLPLDGGRIMRAYLTKKIGSIRAYNISVRFSCIPISLIMGTAVYSLLTNSFNFSLILISAFLLGNLCLEQKNISKNVVSELLNYSTKLDKNALNRSYVITAHQSTSARLILKQLSYDRYYIVCVVDDNLKVTKILTEGEILSADLTGGTVVLKTKAS